MQKLTWLTDKSGNSARVLGRLQTCDSQIGHSLKFYIRRSWAHTCEVQGEEKDEVKKNSLDEIDESEKHRDEKKFSASDWKIDAETGEEGTVTGVKAEYNKISSELIKNNMNVQNNTNHTLQAAQDNSTVVDQLDIENDDHTTGENSVLYKDDSWDAQDECYIFQPVLQHQDSGFSDAIYIGMANFKIKWVAETHSAQRQVFNVAVNVEGARRGWWL